MSVIVDRVIRSLCNDDRVLFYDDGLPLIEPFDEAQLQPSSYDVLLGNVFLSVDESHMKPVDMGDPSTFEDIYERHDVAPGGYYKLSSRGFVLACTAEVVNIPRDFVGILHGKSTRARQGLVIESAGFVDPGFKGQLTMEIFNQFPVPIYLRPGLKIAQISFQELSGYPDRVYGDDELGSHYQNSEGAVGPRQAMRRAA